MEPSAKARYWSAARIAVWILASLLLLSGCWIALLRMEVAGLRSALSKALSREVDEPLFPRGASADAAWGSAGELLPGPEPSAAAAPAGPAEPEAREDAPLRSRGGRSRWLDRVREDPAAAALFKSRVRSQIERRYAGFFRENPWPAELAEAAVEALVRREMARQLARLSAREAGLDPSDPEQMRAWQDEAQLPLEEALRQTVGPAWAERLQLYERSLAARPQVESLENRLAITGANLEPPQRSAVLRLLSESPPAPVRPPFSADDATWEAWRVLSEQRDAAIAAQLSTVLNAEQVRGWMELQVEDRERANLRRQLNQRPGG